MLTSISSGSSIAVPLPGHKSQKRAGTSSYISITSFSQRISDLQAVKKPALLIQKAPAEALENFKKRARAKYLTRAVVSKLVDVSGSPLHQGYWNSWHCSSILYFQGGQLKSKYCKQRWCVVCSRVRTAQVIKQYLPVFREWKDKVFVTLTVPNCSAAALKDTIADIASTFDRIRKRFDNAHRRDKSLPVVRGLRKLEVTYNADDDSYHPHYHLILDSRRIADMLRIEWLYHYHNATWDAQNVKAADDNSCLELCKYFTKLLSSHSKERVIHVDALDTIFQAVSGKRTMQAYGGLRVQKEIADDEAEALAGELGLDAVYNWQQEVADWVSEDTGELLTHYKPDAELKKLVTHGIIRH